jgi:hypothetical protein
MPGHYISASCPCGYRGHASPGARLGGGARVMAYGANEKDEPDLVTVSASAAKRRKLEVIDDPALGRDSTAPNYSGPWPGYRCPACHANTMVLSKQGFWG